VLFHKEGGRRAAVAARVRDMPVLALALVFCALAALLALRTVQEEAARRSLHVVRADLREQVVSFPPQPVITSDNLVVSIDSVVYYQITDPMRATYEISNYLQAIEQLTVTTLRNSCGPRFSMLSSFPYLAIKHPIFKFGF